MNAASIGQETFRMEALGVIFQEAQRAKDAGYKGVNFDGRPDEIWISFASSDSSAVYQPQHYSSDHWQDICLAMHLVDRLARRVGCPGLVYLSGSIWHMRLANLNGKLLSIIYQLLHRVDETIAVLDEHLELPITS